MTVELLDACLHDRDEIFDMHLDTLSELIQEHSLVDVVDSELFEDSS